MIESIKAARIEQRIHEIAAREGIDLSGDPAMAIRSLEESLDREGLVFDDAKSKSTMLSALSSAAVLNGIEPIPPHYFIASERDARRIAELIIAMALTPEEALPWLFIDIDPGRKTIKGYVKHRNVR